MQNAGEIIKEKTGFRKNKREISKGERKSKSEQDLNVFAIRINVKYWRKKSEMDAEYHQKFPDGSIPEEKTLQKYPLFW